VIFGGASIEASPIFDEQIYAINRCETMDLAAC